MGYSMTDQSLVERIAKLEQAYMDMKEQMMKMENKLDKIESDLQEIKTAIKELKSQRCNDEKKENNEWKRKVIYVLLVCLIALVSYITGTKIPIPKEL